MGLCLSDEQRVDLNLPWSLAGGTVRRMTSAKVIACTLPCIFFTATYITFCLRHFEMMTGKKNVGRARP